MKTQSMKSLYILLLADLAVIVGGAYLAATDQQPFGVPGKDVVLAGGIAFAVLGVLMIRRAVRSGVKGRKKIFQIMTGASAAGFLVFAVLHNVVSAALSTMLRSNIEEPVFFILATIVCPVALLVGLIGSVLRDPGII